MYPFAIVPLRCMEDLSRGDTPDALHSRGPLDALSLGLTRSLVSDNHDPAIHQGDMAPDVRMATSLLRGMQTNGHTDKFDIDIG